MDENGGAPSDEHESLTTGVKIPQTTICFVTEKLDWTIGQILCLSLLPQRGEPTRVGFLRTKKTRTLTPTAHPCAPHIRIEPGRGGNMASLHSCEIKHCKVQMEDSPHPIHPPSYPQSPIRFIWTITFPRIGERERERTPAQLQRGERSFGN